VLYGHRYLGDLQSGRRLHLRRNKRLSEQDTFLVVLFDMLQLGLLLYLTGGLNNPFSILIVGPVTVSASALSGRSTAFLGVMAIVMVTLMMQFYLPLRTEDGQVLQVPDVFRFGSWAAIVIAVMFLGVYARWIVQECAPCPTRCRQRRWPCARAETDRSWARGGGGGA